MGRSSAAPVHERIQRSGLQEGAGEAAYCGAEAGAGGIAERAEEAGWARGVGADAEKLRGDSESAAEEIGVDAVEAAESLQGSHLPLEGGVVEAELILRGLIPFRDSLLTGEIVAESGKAGGVACAGDAVGGGLLQRVKGAGDRALRLRSDGGFVGGTEAGIVEDALELRREDAAELLLLAEEALVESVDARELLIGEILSLGLSAAGHFETSKGEVRKQ